MCGGANVRVRDSRSGAVFELVQVFRAKVVDVADEAMTLEVVGDPGKLVALERLMAPFGILEIARTGKVALEQIGRASCRARV